MHIAFESPGGPRICSIFDYTSRTQRDDSDKQMTKIFHHTKINKCVRRSTGKVPFKNPMHIVGHTEKIHHFCY